MPVPSKVLVHIVKQSQTFSCWLQNPAENQGDFVIVCIFVMGISSPQVCHSMEEEESCLVSVQGGDLLLFDTAHKFQLVHLLKLRFDSEKWSLFYKLNQPVCNLSGLSGTKYYYVWIFMFEDAVCLCLHFKFDWFFLSEAALKPLRVLGCEQLTLTVFTLYLYLAHPEQTQHFVCHHWAQIGFSSLLLFGQTGMSVS